MSEGRYVYACYVHAEQRNEDVRSTAKQYATAFEQMDRPLMRVIDTVHHCYLHNSDPCLGPILRWKISVWLAPGTHDASPPS